MSLAVTINLDDVASQIRRAASDSISEEDLRIRVESIFKGSVLEPLGIPWGRYEYSPKKYSTLISGVRIDALHAHVVVEYEKPQSFEQKRNYEHAIQQVKDGIVRHAQGVTDRLPRYFGVALDGFKVGFVRYRQRLKDFEVSREPLDINRNTVARLVEAVVGLKRKALDAEDLLIDFGPNSEISKKVIKVFYDKLNGRVTGRTAILFSDWKRVFSQVCAYAPEKLKGLEEQYGFQKGRADVERLLFSLHSYFALLMKLLAAEVGSLYWPIMGSYLKALEDAYYEGSDRLKDQLREMEEGGLFAKLGISNFLEGDYFAWYLDEWDTTLADSIASVVKKLSDYDPSTAELEPDKIKDLFKRLYQNLVPRKIRHDLGEYYTPDWLAELVLNEVGYTIDNFNKLREGKNDALAPLELRILDPACGSGTFLVLAIKRLREYIDEHWIDKGSALRRISRNVVGFDLNPLAVMASRANYLISIGDMLREKGAEQVEIPIYLADSILIERKTTVLGTSTYSLRTMAGEFRIPIGVVDRGVLAKALGVMEECVKLNYTANEFIGRLQRDVKVKEDEELSLKELHASILKLEREGKNRIWLRVLKNSFAPFLVGKFDLITGNPPWVNWHTLPDDYRHITSALWGKFGLVSHTGAGQFKKDLAMLFTVVSFNRFLVESGKLAFLVPFTVFKTLAGAGFRKYLAHKASVLVVHELVSLNPFEGAVNRPSLLVLEKGKKTIFPVKCLSWDSMTGRTVDFGASLSDILTITKRTAGLLEPIKGKKKPGSSWSFAPGGALAAIRKMSGKSYYRAYMGSNTRGANGVFWVLPIQDLGDDLLVENLASIGKMKYRSVTMSVEKRLLYPLLRGRDIQRWVARKSNYMILVPNNHNRQTITERFLKMDYPKAYAYFMAFRDELSSRKLYGKPLPHTMEFYTLFQISSGIFAPYKVTWKYIAGKITGKAQFSATVASEHTDQLLGLAPFVPDTNVPYVPLNSRQEAHFVCAVINSSLARLLVASYISDIGISAHVLGHLKIPRFDPKNELHAQLSTLSEKAHQLASEGNITGLKNVEQQIDTKVSELYGLTEQELGEAKESLAVLMGEWSEEEEEVEEVPILDPDVTLTNPVVKENTPFNLEIVITNPLENSISNVKIKVQLPTKIIEELFQNIEKEEKVQVTSDALKKGNYRVKLIMDYTFEGSSKRIEKELTLFVKAKEEGKPVERGAIEELW